jgi:toxin ParE1/3/4
MNVEYSKRAVADLHHIAEYYHINAVDPQTGQVLAERIEAAVARIGSWPEMGRRVAERSAVRVVTLRRFPYRIFCRISRETIRILHIRHTSHRPWRP